MDAIRTDEKIAPLDAAIAESYFNAGRDGTNLLDLSVEADIDARAICKSFLPCPVS